MRIAQVAPLFESVPPKLYGGTERIVAYLTEELVRQGHDVTLFASADSETSAELVAASPAATRLGNLTADIYHLLMLEKVFQQRDRFDVIHFHIDYLHFPLARRYGVPHVTTMHGRLDHPDLVPLFRTFPEMPVISISNDQRRPLPWLNWESTIYHGLPHDLFALHEGPGDYLVFIGRVSPEKGLDRAIEIVRRTGHRLMIAAKVDTADEEYFDRMIRPQLDDPHIDFMGEVGGKDKEDLLGGAIALLFPIDWPEPFGLVMIEAIACGTPVVAFSHGSVPEVMRDGVSGYVVGTVDEAVDAVRRLDRIDRRTCRAYFDERFTVERMVSRHLEAYERIAEQRSPRRIVPVAARRRRVAAARRPGETPQLPPPESPSGRGMAA